MTEKEKMLSGMLYDAYDEELVKQRIYARQSSAKFNQTDESEKNERQQILKELLGSIGENVEMSPNIQFDYGYNTYIGDNCYINFNCTILDCAEVHIGDNVLIGPNVSFLTPLHPILPEERKPHTDEKGNIYMLEYCKPITIGDNVWFGGGVIVNPNVTIGHDTVIGSGSVVTRDIPSGVLAAGVPCKVIRKITEADRLEKNI